MPVTKDASGRRFVRAEVEVPGTPEEVWQAIATGPGISSWFVPSTSEERAGGIATANFGPGMDAKATITAWEPPRRLVMDSQDYTGPGGPVVATEWTVESRTGDLCIVRVVHSWFADEDKWDGQFAGHEHGWSAFFRVLHAYLTYFRNQPSSTFQVMHIADGERDAIWKALIAPLGLTNAQRGDRVQSAASAPRLQGTVQYVGAPQQPEYLLKLDVPAPGVAHLFAMPMGEQVYVPIRVFLYGDDAASSAAQEEATWNRWLQERVT